MPSFSVTKFPNNAQQASSFFGLRVGVGGAPAGGDVSWNSDFVNIKQDDGQYATVDLEDEDNSLILRAHQFGFALPADATITGIIVEFQAGASLAGMIFNSGLSLSHPQSTGKATSDHWPANDTVFVRGASNDLWGVPPAPSPDKWTPDRINSSDFSVFFTCENEDENDSVVGRLDYIKVTVHYTTP